MEDNLSTPSTEDVEVTLESATKDLYELCQHASLPHPDFEFEQIPDTPSHTPSFTATCRLPEFMSMRTGKSKKLAKQAVSASMIKLLLSINPSCKEKYLNKKSKMQRKSHVIPELGEFHDHPEKATTCLHKLCKRTGSKLNFEFSNETLYKYQLQTVYGSAEGCGNTPKEAIECASRIILENLERLEISKNSQGPNGITETSVDKCI